MLKQVRGWLTGGAPPTWVEFSGEGPELKVYWSQRKSLELIEGLAYRPWRMPGLGNDVLQLLVPRELHPQVLGLVHCSVGTGHFRSAKTLRRLLLFPLG